MEMKGRAPHAPPSVRFGGSRIRPAASRVISIAIYVRGEMSVNGISNQNMKPAKYFDSTACPPDGIRRRSPW
jgi:hypothetical protein